MFSGSSSNGWPTPPTSPPAGTIGGNPAATGWGQPQQPQQQRQSGWNNNLSVGDVQGRGRSNSDVSKPSWDSVPGWSSNAAAPAPPANTIGGWNTSQPSAQAAGGWNQPKLQHQRSSDRFTGSSALPPPQSSSQNNWGPPEPKSGWAPVGWAPLPPTPSSGWDGKVPGAVTTPVAPVIQVSGPTLLSPNPRWDGSGDGEVKKDLRKAKSATGLEQQRQFQAPGGQYPNSRLKASNRASGQESEDEKKPKKDNNRSPPSMRLFTRSFAEVNKSLGLPEEEVKIRRTERRAVGDVSKAVGVYIYGLPKWVRVPEILAVFSDFGAIVNVAIVSKPRKDDQRAYAYVDYEGPGSAAKAMEALKDKTFFQMKEPLEMRPHFDDSRGLESAPRSVESELKVEKKPAMQKKLSSNDVGKEAKDGKAGDKLESQAFDYNTLHLANLPSTVDKSEVEKLFAGFGNIRRIHIVQRPKDNKAFAFVSFRQTNAAREALKAVKDTRPFSMTENLKVEYSRADSRERSRTKVDEKPSVAAAPKPRSKTLERVERPPKHMRNTRTVVFVREVDEKNKESVKDKLAAVGALKTFHVVPRVDGSGFSAVVCFEKGEDATKAVKDKVENAVFPRQRRLTVTNLPKDVTEGDLKTWLAGTGEIRRVDVDGTTAEVEFSKGDSAVVAFHLMLETMIKGVRVSVGYSPSKKNEEEDEDEKEEKEVAVAAEEVKVEEVHVEVEEVVEVHHAGGDDYFGASSSEDEGDVEVVNLEDLGSAAVGVEVEEVVSLEELGGVAEEEVVSLEDLAEMPVESAAVTVEAVSSVEVVAEKPEVAVEKPAEDVVPAVSA